MEKGTIGDKLFKANYEVDENQTKELTYTVEYYKDNEIVNQDTVTIKEPAQVLEPDTIEIDRTLISDNNKYEGYRISKTEPANIGDTVNNGDVLKVYYILDDGQTKELSYTVEYYKDNVKYEEKVVTENVQLLSSNKLKLDKSLVTNNSLYKGYTYIRVEIIGNDDTNNYENNSNSNDSNNDNTISNTLDNNDLENETTNNGDSNITNEIGVLIQGRKTLFMAPEIELPDEVLDGTIIRVYYEHETYNITYNYNGGNLPEGKTNPEEYTVETEDLTLNNPEKEGYKFIGWTENDNDTPEIEKVIEKGTTGNKELTANFEIDENQTKELKYTVEYYKDGIIVDDDTQVEKIQVQVLKDNLITVDHSKINLIDKYEGYAFKESEPINIPNVVEDGAIIKVYYVTKVRLRVRYVDINTGKELDEVVDGEIKSSTIIAEGTLDEPYETEPKTFNKYITTSNRVFYKRLLEKNPEMLENAGVNNVDEYMEKENIDPAEPYIPENAEGTLEIDNETDIKEVVVTYYYAAKRNVIVKYVDQNTGEEIEDQTIKTGPEGDVYDITEEEKELDGYTLIKVPKQTEGEYTEEDAEVTYYYAKNTEVSVKYIDGDTGKDIDEDENYEIKGYVGKDYKADSKEFKDYKLIGYTDNTEGTMTLDEQEVVYYYEKQKDNTNTSTGESNITNNNPTIPSSNEPTTIIQNITIINTNPVSENKEDTVKQSDNKQESRTVIERITKPKTGDMVPVVAYSTIFVVLVLNIIVYRQNSRKIKKLRINSMILEEKRRKASKVYKNKVSGYGIKKKKKWHEIKKKEGKHSKGKFIK